MKTVLRWIFIIFVDLVFLPIVLLRVISVSLSSDRIKNKFKKEVKENAKNMVSWMNSGDFE